MPPRRDLAAVLICALVDPATKPDAVAFLCRKLGRAGGAAEVPALAARLADLTLAVEPLNRFEAHGVTSQAQAAAFVDLASHASVGVRFDTFHANIEKRDPAASLQALGPKPRHVHASANDHGTRGATTSMGRPRSRPWRASEARWGTWRRQRAWA